MSVQVFRNNTVFVNEVFALSASYVGYTLGHLHQRVAEHTKQSSSIGKHFINEHCIIRSQEP